jgi:hypothetical protein
MSWDVVCGRCGSQRFWPSRVPTLQVCYDCAQGDPWGALECLARRVPGGAQLVRRWRQSIATRDQE